MKLKTLLRIGIIAVSSIALPTFAATTTWLGSELVGVATFPSQQPEISGTSLLFRSSSTQFQKLIDLALPEMLPLGTEIKIRIGMTRPECLNACAGGQVDFDPHLGLSDGSRIVTMALTDNGQFFDMELFDNGSVGSRYQAIGLDPLVLPPIGESFETSVIFRVEANATIFDGALGGYTTHFSSSTVLNPAALHFVLVRDNDTGEQYQIDWLSIEVPDNEIPVAVDIKPGSCPNPLNTGPAKGVVSVAINGDNTTLVTDIDPATVRLAGVAPLRSAYEDVSAPWLPYVGKANQADCHTAGADGLLDLVFKFDKTALAEALGGGALVDGETVVVPLTGALRDGTPITGEDVMWIRNDQ